MEHDRIGIVTKRISQYVLTKDAKRKLELNKLRTRLSLLKAENVKLKAEWGKIQGKTSQKAQETRTETLEGIKYGLKLPMGREKMNYPEIMNTLEILRRYKDLHSYSNAQLATVLESYGWKWDENHLDDLFDGRVKMTDVEEEYFKLVLLQEICDASTMT